MLVWESWRQQRMLRRWHHRSFRHHGGVHFKGFSSCMMARGEIITSFLSPPLKAHHSSTQGYEAFLEQPSMSHGDYFIATTRYSGQAHSGSAHHAEIGEPNRLGSAISEYRLLHASFQKRRPRGGHLWPSQAVLWDSPSTLAAAVACSALGSPCGCGGYANSI